MRPIGVIACSENRPAEIDQNPYVSTVGAKLRFWPYSESGRLGDVGIVRDLILNSQGYAMRRTNGNFSAA